MNRWSDAQMVTLMVERLQDQLHEVLDAMFEKKVSET